MKSSFDFSVDLLKRDLSTWRTDAALAKNSGVKAHPKLGEVKPHTDHVSMASSSYGEHSDRKQAHRQLAAVAQAKGDHDLADKHGMMAAMHDHYAKGIAVDHKAIDQAKKLHQELSR